MRSGCSKFISDSFFVDKRTIVEKFKVLVRTHSREKGTTIIEVYIVPAANELEQFCWKWLLQRLKKLFKDAKISKNL